MSLFPLSHHLNQQSDFKRICYERKETPELHAVEFLTVDDMKMANVQTCEKTAALAPSSSIHGP